MAKNYISVVEKVVCDGKHGLYAVCRCEGVGTVTFSLCEPVWRENCNPETGTYVLLSDIRKKRAGWRAMSARFLRPSDNQQLATRKEQRDE